MSAGIKPAPLLPKRLMRAFADAVLDLHGEPFVKPLEAAVEHVGIGAGEGFAVIAGPDRAEVFVSLNPVDCCEYGRTHTLGGYQVIRRSNRAPITVWLGERVEETKEDEAAARQVRRAYQRRAKGRSAGGWDREPFDDGDGLAEAQDGGETGSQEPHRRETRSRGVNRLVK